MRYFIPLNAIIFILSACGTSERLAERNDPVHQPIADLFLPDDLEVTLWAESPHFYNPTNIDVDHKGRIWVAEAVNYRSFNNAPENRLHHEKGDRIMILEDTNGDGVADHSKVFVQDEDLVAPMGVAVIGNKVIVSCAPHLIIYTDDDGDDVPDKKEIFLKGFGGFDHDHSLHSVVAGPDGNWYFNTGNAGPHIVTDHSGWTLRSGSLYTGGSPYNTSNQGRMVSDDGRVWVGGLALRIDKDGKNLKVMAHNFRNSYELAIDSYGNMWQNDNDDEVVTCRVTYVMEGGNAGFFSADGTRTWKADRRPDQDIFTAHWHQDDPGVMPAGDNTGSGSPTGVVVYESDLLGEQYRGMLLSADAGRNVIFGYLPEENGAGFDLKRSDFISSLNESTEEYVWNKLDDNKRKWFRPSDVAVGTDGAIYIADWFDPIVGGHAMRDTTGYGRIYRIAPKDKKLTVPVINIESLEGQIEAFLSPAINVRNMGFERLKERGKEVVSEVKKISISENPYHQARAIWLLAQLGNEGVSEVEAFLRFQNPDLRLTAFRALKTTEKWLQYAELLKNDLSPAVRREVAIALRDVPFKQCQEIILALAERYDVKDRWYLEALGTALQGKEPEGYSLLLKEIGNKDPLLWDEPFAKIAWRLHPPETVEAFKERATSSKVSEQGRKEAIVALSFINNIQAVEAMEALASNSDKAIARQASWLLNFRKTNDWYTLKNWEEGKKTPENIPGLLAFNKKLIDNNLPLEERIAAAREMMATDDGSLMVIRNAAENKLPESISEFFAEEHFQTNSQYIQVLASHYFPFKREKKLSLENISDKTAVAERGKKAFMANCQFCHKAGEMGGNIGPELTYIRRKLDKDFLIDAIIDPNKEVQHGYQLYMITEKNGAIHCGFLLSEGNMLLINKPNGILHSVSSSNVASKILLKDISIMPDPELLGLDEQEIADITEFLLLFKPG